MKMRASYTKWRTLFDDRKRNLYTFYQIPGNYWQCSCREYENTIGQKSRVVYLKDCTNCLGYGKPPIAGTEVE